MASGTHDMDVKVFIGPLKQVMDECPEVEFEVIGSVNPLLFEGLPKGRVHTYGWTSYGKLPEVMQKWDIGIAPLQDIPFNRAKSEIKALQYWAFGMPVVASGIPPYEPLTAGILLANSHDDWYNNLKKLVSDLDFRKDLGQIGFREVRGVRGLNYVCGQWRSLFITGDPNNVCWEV
jgi:glycosyltransferase involved in cell wall biosynthesis